MKNLWCPYGKPRWFPNGQYISGASCSPSDKRFEYVYGGLKAYVEHVCILKWQPPTPSLSWKIDGVHFGNLDDSQMDSTFLVFSAATVIGNLSVDMVDLKPIVDTYAY